jgi:hypothetical protein
MRTARASTIETDDHLRLADVRRRVKAIFIGSVGNLVEWYDFYAYAAFALYFASAFFPGNDPVVYFVSGRRILPVAASTAIVGLRFSDDPGFVGAR